ncbi:Imm59 family immunity protein [Streptococcus intermedius]|uniref:Uncharacterized protein n=1 Tax=Streptococcus intermedius TaxID=1338 RepID=A0AAD1C8M5_STRIT|nr:Imm59 family immunity protein [Streptococcus intermedius]MDK8090666.1 Imm59 family immunity protein [Streptococcus intermedius]BAW16990.1 hypothetical protein SITYG_10090 [Streptococcus intermedius]
MEEINRHKLMNDLENTIRQYGYESLYYVLFNEHSSQPWAIHFYYQDGYFKINSRDDRSYIIGKTWEFANFEEAKFFFIKKMTDFIRLNRLEIKTGHEPYYSSPLWDKTDN